MLNLEALLGLGGRFKKAVILASAALGILGSMLPIAHNPIGSLRQTMTDGCFASLSCRAKTCEKWDRLFRHFTSITCR